MDPNAALQNIRAMCAAILDSDEPQDARAIDLANACEALDGWLTKGGFLPAAWVR